MLIQNNGGRFWKTSKLFELALIYDMQMNVDRYSWIFFIVIIININLI